jgi:hypothetical protein
MFHSEQHHMELVETYTSGAEEWHCPTCNRRFLMQWSPYKKIVLVSGDEHATHSGGKGGMKLSNADVVESDNKPAEEEFHFSEELRNAINELDFGD